MSTDRRIRWTATTALAVSCFALGFSAWSVGCQGRDRGAAATREQPTARHMAPAKTPAAVTPVVAPAQPDVHSDTAPAQPKPAEPAPHASAPSAAGLEVKRLVVTRGIEHREPLDTDQLTAGAGPVFAFVELQNNSDDDKLVTVDFQHDGAEPVGHIKLRVPAHSPRWRTWGRTRLVDHAGKWTAIVRAADGTNLAHSTFNVEAHRASALPLGQARRAPVASGGAWQPLHFTGTPRSRRAGPPSPVT